MPILQRALATIEYDLQHYFVHAYLIQEIVVKTYLEDKRSSLPFNTNSLFNSINKYINSIKNFFFLLSVDEAKRLKIEINNLVYVEVIHQIPSSALPLEIMDDYKGFYVDSGKYLHTLNYYSESKSDNVYEFSYLLPNSLKDDYKRYVINLDNIESEFIECANCGFRFSKNHAVYAKVKICPNCAFAFK